MSSSLEQGQIYVELGRYEDAIVCLQKAKLEDPLNVNAYYHLAWSYYLTNRPATGMFAAAEGLAVNPESSELLTVHAACAFRSESYDIAKRSLQSALESDPENAHAHYIQAEFLASDNQPKQGLVSINQAISLDPENSLYRALRSNILSILGDRSGARASSLESLRLNPTNAHSHIQRGLILRRDGEVKRSFQSLHEALRNDPNNLDAKSEVLETGRNRFPPYRWIRSFLFWLLRFPNVVRVVFWSTPIVSLAACLVLVEFAKSWSLWFLSYTVIFLFGLFVLLFTPSVMDGLFTFDRRFKHLLNQQQKVFSIVSMGAFVWTIVAYLRGWILRYPPAYDSGIMSMYILFVSSLIYLHSRKVD